MQKATLSLLSILLALPLLSCSCVGTTTSFDLHDYDRAYDVVELVASKLASTELSDAMSYDRTDKKEIRYHMTVRQSFKGKLNPGDLIRLYTRYPTGANCGAVLYAESIIIYLSSPRLIDGKPVFGTSMCTRRNPRVTDFPKPYNDEISILQQLRDRHVDTIETNQSVRKFSHSTVSTTNPFTGGFFNGKRHGEWVINRPVRNFDAQLSPDEPVLRLIYQNDSLLRVQLYGKQPLYDSDYFEKRWLKYYQKQVNQRAAATYDQLLSYLRFLISP